MKKCFKKVLSVLLSVMLLLGTFGIGMSVFAEDDTLNFVHTTDLHVEKLRDTLPINYPESEIYFHAGGSGNLYCESTAIVNSCLEQAKAQNADFVMISGDLTRSGTEQEHRYVAKLLDDFQKKTGMPIFVISGNHDYYNSTPSEFKEYYNELGYKNALAVDDVTASYTADLPKNYRLIAIDSNNPGKDGDGVDERLLNWVDAQVQKAHEDGKEIIAMMHHPLIQHIVLHKIILKDFILRDSENVAEMFCNWGIQYVYTGHEHGNDIKRYVGKNRNVVYDILTTSLTSYPLEYRFVTYSKDGVKIEMQSIDECDFSRLINGYNEKQLELMKNDYSAYAHGYFNYSISRKIIDYTSPEFIKKKLKVTDGALADAIDVLMGLVNEALDMPLYGEGMSIEALAAKKGIIIPKTDYASISDLLAAMASVHYFGNENLPSSKYPEAELFTKALNTGLEFILSNTNKEIFGLLIPILAKFGITDYEICDWLATVGSEESYKKAEEVLFPLLEKIIVDAPQSDRSVELPPFGEKVTLLSVIMTYLEKIFNVVKYLLNIIF